MKVSGFDPQRSLSPSLSRAARIAVAAACLLGSPPEAPGATPCSPGWNGSLLINCDTLTGWSVESDVGASGSLRLVPGIVGGQAVELDWNLGTGQWVQAKFTFPRPMDLSRADLLGISLRGGGPAEISNTVGFLIADVNGVFHGYDMAGKNGGVNQIDRAMMNLPVPRKLLRFFFATGPEKQIDWTRINRFFLVVKRPGASQGGGSGRMTIDHVQEDAAALWTRQTAFETVTPREDAARRAVAYLISQQKSTGLFLSWKEEPSPKAWLYDQALALIVLSREGAFPGGAPGNEAARAAKRLVDFLISRQKADGHWARAWTPATGSQLADDGWVGDQAWCVMALAGYSGKSGSAAAGSSASRGAAWLVSKIDPEGKLVPGTEGNVDTWWAMVSTCRLPEAERIKTYLLGEDTVWDRDLRYWWRGSEDPVVAMDASTWLSAFARHPLVQETERSLAALSFTRRALVTSSDDGSRCGFDGMGPVSLWNEGTGQYVAAGGLEADRFLDELVAQQRADGSLPGSPDAWSSDSFGWLTNWSGLAPTCWFYFAVTGPPFPMQVSRRRGDSTGDGRLDLADPLAILVHLFLDGRIENGCGEAVADANGDGAVDLGDPIFLLFHLFLGGPEPPSSDPACHCAGG